LYAGDFREIGQIGGTEKPAIFTAFGKRNTRIGKIVGPDIKSGSFFNSMLQGGHTIPAQFDSIARETAIAGHRQYKHSATLDGDARHKTIEAGFRRIDPDKRSIHLPCGDCHFLSSSFARPTLGPIFGTESSLEADAPRFSFT
jgi:hypothetical protein